MTLLTFITFVFAIIFVTNSRAQSCFPADNCDFYECVESKLKCGPNGYPVSYGTKMCELVLANQGSLDSDGQMWAISTRLCLQNTLIPIVHAPEPATCDELWKHAFNSHPECYVLPENSVCDIGPIQIVKVINLVGIQLTEEYWRQFSSVAKTCTLKWYNALKNRIYSAFL